MCGVAHLSTDSFLHFHLKDNDSFLSLHPDDTPPGRGRGRERERERKRWEQRLLINYVILYWTLVTLTYSHYIFVDWCWVYNPIYTLQTRSMIPMPSLSLLCSTCSGRGARGGRGAQNGGEGRGSGGRGGRGRGDGAADSGAAIVKWACTVQ